MATSQTEPFVPGAPQHDNPYQQDRSRLLPDLNQFLLAYSDIRTCFSGICRRLNRVLPHQYAGMALYEADSGQLRLFTQQTPPGSPALPVGFTFPLDGTPTGEAYRLQRPILVEDLRSPQFTCETTRELLKFGHRSGCWVPLRTASSVFGAMWISSAQPGAFRAEDACLLNEVAGQISLALAYQLASQQMQELRQRMDKQLHDGSLSFSEIANTSAIGVALWEEGGRLSNANNALLSMVGRTREEMQRIQDSSAITPPEYHHLAGQAEQELRQYGFCHPFEKELLRPDGTRVPVLISAGVVGNTQPPWVAFVMDLRERRRISPETSVPGMGRHATPAADAGDLAAKSPAMHKILREIEKVAPTDTTMLLLGETGTGKDVLAHAICQMSPRRHHPFIKVNCAAIPAGLLESELFGHERGAYTGAQARKIGRLELAHEGTLFLDEVGDIPLELQPKLLRVLQEREFERLGGTQTIKVNIRLIAATNRDLAAMTISNQFRRDLFYRLNVFPVRVPPLRERPESISVLVNSFIQKFAKRMNRPNLTVPLGTLAALELWSWPGNIRELENLIERAVILSPGPELRVNLDELREASPASSSPGQTLHDVEREHIRHVLHDTNGVVGGKHGAASRLGLKRTTLQYKMKKLEISRY
jgi:formate hydrogenlyase transcriptional activator